MSDAIISAIITGLITLGGVLITNGKTMAIIQTEIKHLTEEVKKHNNFAQRIPELEGEVKLLGEKISVANHRISDLEKK